VDRRWNPGRRLPGWSRSPGDWLPVRPRSHPCRRRQARAFPSSERPLPPEAPNRRGHPRCFRAGSQHRSSCLLRLRHESAFRLVDGNFDELTASSGIVLTNSLRVRSLTLRLSRTPTFLETQAGGPEDYILSRGLRRKGCPARREAGLDGGSRSEDTPRWLGKG
jgi:hypothetical protein